MWPKTEYIKYAFILFNFFSFSLSATNKYFVLFLNDFLGPWILKWASPLTFYTHMNAEKSNRMIHRVTVFSVTLFSFIAFQCTLDQVLPCSWWQAIRWEPGAVFWGGHCVQTPRWGRAEAGTPGCSLHWSHQPCVFWKKTFTRFSRRFYPKRLAISTFVRRKRNNTSLSEQ